MKFLRRASPQSVLAHLPDEVMMGESMRGCVLRLVVEAPHAESVLRVGGPLGLSRAPRADFVSPGRAQLTDVLELTVSTRSGEDIDGQIVDATAMLEAHATELQLVVGHVGVRNCFLDFRWNFPARTAGRWGRFPMSLLDLCVRCGIELEVTSFST